MSQRALKIYRQAADQAETRRAAACSAAALPAGEGMSEAENQAECLSRRSRRQLLLLLAFIDRGLADDVDADKKDAHTDPGQTVEPLA